MTVMPAELEAQLRAITPTCQATRIRDIKTLFGTRTFEEPCGQPATHILHIVCSGPHDPYPGQLTCAEHHGALEAMRARGTAHWRCACGGIVLTQTVTV